jgi:Mg2+/Co2+ transporter CorB
VLVIVAIIGLIALLVVIFAPVLKKWAGLSPTEDILYNIGPFLTIGGLLIVLVVGVPMIQDFMKGRKNKR